MADVFATLIVTREPPPDSLDSVFPAGTRAVMMDLTDVISDRDRIVERFKVQARALYRTYVKDPKGWL
ncbi:hypothetical protein LCGC14_2872230, partial [marine sediment metagenome]